MLTVGQSLQHGLQSLKRFLRGPLQPRFACPALYRPVLELRCQASSKQGRLMLTLYVAEISEEQTAWTAHRVNGGAETALTIWGNDKSTLFSEV